MECDAKIYVAGHRGLVGSAIVRRLVAEGCTRLLTTGRDRVELTEQAAVEAFFQAERPDYVFLAAAKVGGIHANNTYPAEFIRDNLMIQTNVIHTAWRAGVKKLCFLGSSCIYPKLAAQPMTEDALLTGPLEPTNEWYAIAKIAGIKMCQAYRRQYGFDAISLIAQGIKNTGSTDSDAIIGDWNKQSDYPGLFGNLHYTPTEHNGYRTNEVVMSAANSVRDGAFNLAPGY